MLKPTAITTRRRTTLLFNPAGLSHSGAGRRGANPGELIALGPLNPRRTMNPRKKKKTKTKAKGHQKKGGARRNPADFLVLAHKKPPARRHRPRRNPDLMAVLKKPVEVLKHGLYATGGLLAARQLPQLLLGSRNTGLIGYAANIVTALMAGALAGAAFGAPAGASVMIGGGLYTVTRGLTEQTAIGRHLVLSGAGDPIAAGHLGALVPGYFAHPAVVNRETGQPAIPEAIVRAVLSRMPPPAAATSAMNLAGGRFAPRF